MLIKVSTGEGGNVLPQSPHSDGVWGDHKFVVDSNLKYCDCWIILYSINNKEYTYCPKNKIIFVTGEPPNVMRYNKGFLSQFAQIITSQYQIQDKNIHHLHQILPWMVNKSYDELVNLPPLKKTSTLSIICSNKKFTKEHNERLNFSLDLKGYFGNRIDFFGRGFRDFEDKWDVLAPYKYSIAIENYVSDDYITEKLCDNFLSYTHPIYYGAPNVGKYYPKDSMTTIDIHNFDKSIEIIESVLSTPNYYEMHLPALIDARNIYLNKYSLFPSLARFINCLSQSSDRCVSNHCVSPQSLSITELIFKSKRKLWQLFHK